MSRDRLENVAEELFRAARNERPDPGLAERILAHTEAAPNAERSRLHPIRTDTVRRSAWRVKWLLAAALLVPSLVYVTWKARPSASVVLTAEPLSSRSAARGVPTSRAPRLAPPASMAVREPSTPPPRQVSAAPQEAATVARKAHAAPALTPAQAGAATAPSASATSLPLSLSEQIGILKQARAALRSGDGANALVILDRYESASSAGGLQAESTLLRIEALAAVGRRAEAEAVARRFIAENPHSPLAERARTFVGPATNP